ncbi:hypothetical protein DXG01_010725 [Tephrocybe rancida]|nr:hypothetical protein DXG01_010725 [Tephrocybe rancida]
MNQTSLDKQRGRVLILDGDMYYSPNSSRRVELPPYDEHKGRQHKIFERKDARVEIYHQPRWWTLTFGWVSFVSIKPCFYSSLFEPLAKFPTRYEKFKQKGIEFGYCLPQKFCDDWRHLEECFVSATSIMADTYETAASRPFSPWALGYAGGYRSYKYAVERATRSRDWFSIWMGLMSYLIAVVQSPEKWVTLLKGRGFEQTWLDSLLTSTVCDFSSNAFRAGIFLDLIEPGDCQPDVKWFINYNVPVWYRWGQLEAGDKTLAHLAPLPSQMQEATTTLTVVPSITPQIHLPSKNHAEGVRAYTLFFAARQQRNAKLLLTETPTDRQARLSRERKPPTSGAKVFEWETTQGDPTLWVRVPVGRIHREETLGNYSAAQKRYDSFRNEWDCCEEFGDGDDDDDDGWDSELWGIPTDSIDPTQPLTALNPVLSAPMTLTHPPEPAQILDAERIDVSRSHPLRDHYVGEPLIPHPNTIDLLEQEVLETLILHYGYTPPIPLPTYVPPINNEGDYKRLVRLLGLSWARCQNRMSQRYMALAKVYLDSFISGVRPSNDACDFNVYNRATLAHATRLKHLRFVETVQEKPTTLYMFDFGGRSEAPWKLAMIGAADALMVCRLDGRMGEYEIASYLLGHGIPFRTLISSESISRAPREPPPLCVLPMRLSDAQFTQKDYDNYARERSTLLRHPRVRVALMRGGFAWRLCAPIVSFESVLQGPTGWNPVPGTMFTARDPKTNEIFVDDELTEVELNSITGTYVCLTGLGAQTAMRSWFPLSSTFEAGGEDYRRWNDYREDDFQRRLAEISKPTSESRGPLNAKKWRDLMRGTKDMRRLKDVIERWSENFIKENL